jgi:hypothetical protein
MAEAVGLLKGLFLLLLDIDAVCSFETDLIARAVAFFRPNSESIFDDWCYGVFFFFLKCKRNCARM